MRPEIFLLVLAAGVGDLVGGLLAAAGQGQRPLAHLSALTGGVMLGTCLLILLPEVVEPSSNGPLAVAAGFLSVFVAENLFGHRAHEPGSGHRPSAATHELVGALVADEPLITRLASWIAFAGLGVHAFFDGAAIVLGWSAGAAAGWATFFAVGLHKIPEGVSVAAIMLAASQGNRRAVIAAAALGILTVAGALAAAAAENLGPTTTLLAFATGTLLYVAAADLLPMVSRTGPATAPITVGAGVALVQGAVLLVRAVGLE